MAVQTSIAPARRVPRVDVVRLALSALVVAQVAVAIAFVAHRLALPSDGTEIGAGTPYAASTVALNAGHAGANPLQAGDRVLVVFGRSMDDWAASLVDPAASRPTIRVGDPVPFTIERDGRAIPLIVTAAPFDWAAAIAADWGVLVLALSIEIVGVYLFARRPEEPAARALLVAGTAMFASTIPWSLGLQVLDLVTARGFWLYAAGAGLVYSLFWCGVLHFALVFPHPHPLAGGRSRLITIAYVIPIAAQLALILGVGVATGRVLAAFDAWIGGQAVLQVAVIAASVALMGHSYSRLVDPVSRLQLRWIAAAVGVAAVSGLLLWFGPELILGEPLVPRSAVALLALPFPIALAVTVSRHHLFDLDAIVNRSLVYLGLTGGVVVTYAMTVALLGRLIPGNAPFAAALLSAGAVAVIALPLRDRLQRSVNRRMYGDRDDPDRALRRLGRRLEASIDPQTVLPTLVEAVGDALRSPYVAIELARDGDADDEARAEAASGVRPVDAGQPRDLVRVPIVYRGRQVGRLILSPRGPRESFSAIDERLLADLARQAAPAVEAVRLTADLRRSREELVSTREEERRRLRRDLHDELGPALAGSLMKVAAARRFIASDPARAATLLDDLEVDARGMIDEIRRIAHNLRPPSLDMAGLVGALRQQVATFDGGTAERRLRVDLDAPDELPPLPAAVEIAGLRIALEGLTNAARHSGASTVRISLGVDGDSLLVSVTDDGSGISDTAPIGIGLASMRERADELGGSFRVLAADGGGTTVVARLPLGRSGQS
jgi:signal transduction histidine kinase